MTEIRSIALLKPYKLRLPDHTTKDDDGVFLTKINVLQQTAKCHGLLAVQSQLASLCIDLAFSLRGSKEPHRSATASSFNLATPPQKVSSSQGGYS